METFVPFRRINDQLIRVKFMDREQTWHRVHLRKSAVCCISGAVLSPGDAAYREVSSDRRYQGKCLSAEEVNKILPVYQDPCAFGYE